MKNFTRRFAFSCALISLVAAHAASAKQTNFMITTAPTSQPIGHHWYCQQYTSDCLIETRAAVVPQLTRERWNDLVAVNAFSNNTVRPVTDMEAYNREEYWAYPTSFGDCEDYVLMKRHMLIQRGWHPSSLLITVVLQNNGEGHAVLTVRTDRGDFILDNLNHLILKWKDTEYSFVKRQSENHSGLWVKIQDFRG